MIFLIFSFYLDEVILLNVFYNVKDDLVRHLMMLRTSVTTVSLAMARKKSV